MIFTCANDLSSSSARCVELPAPDDPNEIVSGLALARRLPPDLRRLDHRRRTCLPGSLVTNPLFGWGQITDQVFELIQLGKPLVGLVQVLDCRIDAGCQAFCIFCRYSIRAQEFDLLVQPVLFRDYKRQV